MTNTAEPTVVVTNPYTGRHERVSLEDSLGFDELPDLDTARELASLSRVFATMSTEITAQLAAGTYGPKARAEMNATIRALSEALVARVAGR